MNTPTPNPHPEPAGDPPSGTTGAEQKCCPDVATFEGHRSQPHKFGFDAKTNLAASEADNYWEPITKGKSMPSDMLTRDGGRWVSVAVGQSKLLEITFDGHSSTGCLMNCSFHVIPAGVAKVETTVINSTTARFVITGLTQGEATMVVRCAGVDRGWFHVASLNEYYVPVRTGYIMTDRTQEPSYTASGLQSVLDRVLSQTVMFSEVTDLGLIDLRGNPAAAAAELPFYGGTPVHGNGVFAARAGFAEAFKPVVEAKVGAAPSGTYDLFYYVPGPGYKSDASGAVVDLGVGPAFAFRMFDSQQDGYAVLAHELAHLSYLGHPDAAGDQLPAHLTGSVGQPIPAYSATVTEPATPSEAPHPLIMSLDPLNLMGYWPDFKAQLYLRRNQWYALRNEAVPSSKPSGGG